MKTIEELEKHDGLACEYGYNVKVIPLEDAISFAKSYAQQQVAIAVKKALEVAADKAKINLWRDFPKPHDIDLDKLSSQDEIGGVEIICVSKQSILSLAPEILKELNNEKN